MTCSKKVGAVAVWICLMTTALVVGTPAGLAAQSKGTPTTLAGRLDGLVDQFELKREQLHIPGMALAVVKDGQVILARGFGFADVAEKRPVTDKTLFPIGSTTKAFTATLIGMLVDDGKMSWDDPVTKHIPFFDLAVRSDDDQAVVTIRDLLSHSTGFARMPILHVGDDVSRSDVLHAAARAEPLAEFRERFHYSNVMYLAAGVAAGNAAASNWETLIERRLLRPLGMRRSSSSFRAVPSDDQLSHGFLWDEAQQALQPQKARDNEAIAPAGAIVSNVLDMAKWLQFQLGRGQYGDRHLISEARHQETWTRQIDVGGGVAYGFGWMLHEWEGQPVVEHPGNTRGYASHVAMLPESDLGFVLLMNVTASPLQQLASNMVWQALTDTRTDDAVVTTDDGFGPLVGKYLPTHRPGEFTVSEQNGRLAVELAPNPTVFELQPPDDEGKRYFLVSDQMAVSFERDEAGDVVVMKVYQSGREFESVRSGVELPSEIAADQLSRYLGTYRSETSDTTLEAFIQNNRLAINVPGRVIYELHPPNEEGLWAFRIDSEGGVKFNETEGGRVISLTSYRGGAAQDELTRVAGTQAPPKLEDLIALRAPQSRAIALERLGTLRLAGSVRLIHSGVEGTVEWYVDGVDLFRQESDYGRFGVDRLVVNGDMAWSESPGSPGTVLHGPLLEQARRSHPAAILGDWRESFSIIRILRTAELDGRRVWVVYLAGGAAPGMTLHVDADTGDVLVVQKAILDSSSTVRVPLEVHYEDYREVEGIRIPFRIVTTNSISGRSVLQFDHVEVRVEIDEGVFARG